MRLWVCRGTSLRVLCCPPIPLIARTLFPLPLPAERQDLRQVPQDPAPGDAAGAAAQAPAGRHQEGAHHPQEGGGGCRCLLPRRQRGCRCRAGRVPAHDTTDSATSLPAPAGPPAPEVRCGCAGVRALTSRHAPPPPHPPTHTHTHHHPTPAGLRLPQAAGHPPQGAARAPLRVAGQEACGAHGLGGLQGGVSSSLPASASAARAAARRRRPTLSHAASHARRPGVTPAGRLVAARPERAPPPLQATAAPVQHARWLVTLLAESRHRRQLAGERRRQVRLTAVLRRRGGLQQCSDGGPKGKDNSSWQWVGGCVCGWGGLT